MTGKQNQLFRVTLVSNKVFDDNYAFDKHSKSILLVHLVPIRLTLDYLSNHHVLKNLFLM